VLIYMQDMSENVEEVMIHIFSVCRYITLSIHAVVYEKSS
jgi:hypothetical protein